MRKNRSVPSSLELFLDTICNVFGGILFIAILIAILIRQTEGMIKKPEDNSPERIAELQQQLDKISADIAAAALLLDTLHASMPKPKDAAEQQAVDLFFQLSAAKGTAASKKAKLAGQQFAAEQELIAQQQQTAQLEQQIQQQKEEKQRIGKALMQHQQEKQVLKTSSETLQSEADELQKQIAAKERNIKNHETKTQRNEILYLPKLQDAGSKHGRYFVLRFNRFYAVADRGSFHYRGNELGIPKKDRGIEVNGSEESKKKIQSLLSGISDSQFPSVFVYGDSADHFHIIRDLIISAGFKYELIPTADDTLWTFGGSGGSRSVQ